MSPGSRSCPAGRCGRTSPGGNRRKRTRQSIAAPPLLAPFPTRPRPTRAGARHGNGPRPARDEASTPVARPSMDFVLTLHGHLPYVLHHGRWPHGSVWLCEAAFDSYLPLIEALQGLERDKVASPITLGITPVLANQLAHPSFVSEFEAYMARRLEGAAGAPAHLAASGDAALVPIARFWHDRLTRLLTLFRSLDGDLIGALRGFEDRGRIELISSAATHGFLPLLSRDESIRLQLAVGVAEHKRLFGRTPTGCWLPECAYRPGGPWNPPGVPPALRQMYRPGTDEHLAAAGYRYFFVDTHLVRAGAALGYPEVEEIPATGERTPYVAYRVASANRRASATRAPGTRRPASGRDRAVRRGALWALVVRGRRLHCAAVSAPLPQRCTARDRQTARDGQCQDEPHDPAHGRLVGQERRLLDVAERPDNLDVAAVMGAGASVLGGRAESAQRRTQAARRPGPGHARDAAGAGVGLAVHHLHR